MGAMETNYDEDLNENVFYQMLNGEHKELFQKATAEGWVICVPRAGSLPKYALTDNDIYSHILIPSDELPESHFRSLNEKDVRICNRVITVEQDDISRPYSTHILFEETFYTDDYMKYKVLCVESPLDQQCEPGQMSDVGIVSVNTLQDCIDLLWTESSGKDVLEQMDDAVTNFLKDNDGVELEPLQKQRDQTSALYSRCLQIALRDARLREKTTANKHLLQSVKVAVETYLHHGIYHILIKGVTACTAYEDAALNKIIRNVSDLQLRDLGVRSDLYDTVPKAKQELARIDRYSTVLGKIGCIKKTLAAISRTRPGEDPTKGNIIAADDLLPMMVFLVIKASLANWIAHLTVMKTFRFSASASCQTDEASFLITSLEAAIEHVKSGVLLGPSEPEAQWVYESSKSEGSDDDFEVISNSVETVKLEARSDLDPSSIAYLFEHIRVGNEDEVVNVLDNGTKQPKKEVDSSLALCHPLCSCDRCEGLLSKVLCVTTPTIHSCDDRGFTALHVASLYGQPQIVDLLLSRGASVNVSDYSGSTPMHYAASRGHQNALLLLAHTGAEIQCRDNEGNAPLHLSAGNGHEGCVKALLYFSEHVGVRLDVNSTNTNGDTALHHAARWGYEGIVNILLEYGANPSIENKRKLTPSHYAHNLHVSRLLSNAVSSRATGKSSPLDLLKKPSKTQSDVSIAAVHKEKLDFSDDHDTCSLNGSIGEHSSIRPHNTDQIKRVEKLLRAIAVGDTRLACYYLGLEGPGESLQCNNEVIFGPMFSGKTTELIRRLKRYQIAKYRCLILRYARDVRYSTTGIATHDKQELPAVSAEKLSTVRHFADDVNVIGIDEGQFFPDCVDFAEEMANAGKIVIVAALDGDFQRIGFGDILRLVPLAESVVKLKAVCMACFNDASFTKRTSLEKELEIIGGEDKYMAVCRRCHLSVSTITPSKFPLSERTNNKLTPSKMEEHLKVKRDLSNALKMDAMDVENCNFA